MIKSKSQKRDIPTYSLVGDLIGYLRCGLQYRMHRRAQWKSAYDGQLWYGQFIHRVMVIAYSKYKELEHENFQKMSWLEDIRPIEISAYRNLLNQDLSPPVDVFCPYDSNEKKLRMCDDTDHPHKKRASYRAEAAIKILGPILFPHLDELEYRLGGIREVEHKITDLDFYAVKGVTDVILTLKDSDSILHSLLENGSPIGTIIIDYKGSSYPDEDDEAILLQSHMWQIIEYGWLFQKKTGILPQYGMLIYINDLFPFEIELASIRNQLVNGLDVRAGNFLTDRDRELILNFKEGDDIPILSPQFRLMRSLKVVEITREMVDMVLRQFDKIVLQIEEKLELEKHDSLIRIWPSNPQLKNCRTCDYRFICPGVKKTEFGKEISIVPDVPPPISEYLKMLHTKE